MIIRERKYFNGSQICDKQITEQQLDRDLHRYLKLSERYETELQTYMYRRNNSEQKLLKRVTIKVNFYHSGILNVDYTIKHDWKERDL